jgi:DNA-binding CsgD family transcriptional regulator
MAEFSLSDRERRLVELLAEGHTDATAARGLRVSERTVSTSIRKLMDRFDVQNRFQLGLALGAAMPELVPTRSLFMSWMHMASDFHE